MALPGNKNFSDYDNYITDQNPTTSAQAQDYFRNQAELLKAVIDCDFWQPETVYQPGDVVKSDSMPNGTEAVMVATKASVTSNVEPQWGAVGGANISDGACFWKLRWQHFSKNIATQAEAEAGTDNAKGMTPLRTAQEIDKQRPIKSFTDVEQFGGNRNMTEEELLVAMPDNSYLCLVTNNFEGNEFPNFSLKRNGMLTIKKAYLSNYADLTFIDQDFKMWRTTYKSWETPKFKPWYRMAVNGALSMPSGSGLNVNIDSDDSYWQGRYIAPFDGWFVITTYAKYMSVNAGYNYWASPMSATVDRVSAFVPLAKGQEVLIHFGSEKKSERTVKFYYAQSEV